jgi:bacterioferritin (cytochrome b1)
MATQQTTQDFAVRQLLKAYRKGLISDELFEAQIKELTNGAPNGRAQYTYNGKPVGSEPEMIMQLLDEFRCRENFAAEYFNRWIAVSDQECARGGLRVIQQREAYHAQVLEARLRELGGIPQCTVPAERRDKDLAFYGSAEKTDAEKLLALTSRITDPAQTLKYITDVIDQIREDQQSKELLRSLVQDELSSITWLKEACAVLNPAQ